MIMSCLSRQLVKITTVSLLFSGLINNVHAGFQFYRVDVDPVVLTDNLPEAFNYTFTATFNSYCTDDCQGYQDYILGLSAFKSSLETGDLPLYVGESLSITAPDSEGSSILKKLSLGSYKGTWRPDSNEQPPPMMKATFSVTFKKTGLEKLFRHGRNLDFYIRGADVEGDQSYHNYHVTIPLEKPPMVKVVGLNDVVVDTSSVTNGLYEREESFCVYVSENPHTYRLSIETENNQRDSFYLAASEITGVGEAYLPYSVSFSPSSTSDSPWVSSSGLYPVEEDFIGNLDESCSSTNMQVRIKVDTEGADKVPMSVYEDRMYVTVGAQ